MWLFFDYITIDAFLKETSFFFETLGTERYSKWWHLASNGVSVSRKITMGGTDQDYSSDRRTGHQGKNFWIRWAAADRREPESFCSGSRNIFFVFVIVIRMAIIEAPQSSSKAILCNSERK